MTLTMAFVTWPSDQLIVALVFGYLTAVAYFVTKGYYARRQFSRLRKQGMPMPPWSPIFGHLLAFPSLIKMFPKNAPRTYLFGELYKPFVNSDGLLYLDTWPFGSPILVVVDPAMANQASSPQLDLPKPAIMKAFLDPFTGGGDNLASMNGSEWKHSRSIFNPGFSANYLLGQISSIVHESSVFVDILKEHAQKGDIFSMDNAALWFTMDNIGSLALNARFNSQRQYNPLAMAMRSQIEWHTTDDELNPFIRWNPIRPFIYWRNSRRMNAYISNQLDKRFNELRLQGKESASCSIMDLVLQDYITEHPTAEEIDKTFREWAITQIRLFLFVGHDSTSSTICYCYYLLSKHPAALARVRAEHDEVFGADVANVGTILVNQPHLINKLPYMLAVIKEVLRLFPPAQGIRYGTPGAFLEDSSGNKYPTEDMNVLIVHPVVHRHPKHWVDADRFIPERWLVGPEDPLYPVKGAWRAFEFGPRNCQGQALVMLDVSVALVMTARLFGFHPAYEEWDKLNPKNDIREVYGERAYQVLSGAMHPADGMPCRVSLRQ
ncbi:afln vera monooxygenase [Phlyctema vagabunda]|uniref:Afln vera monooxygenase n=1 Tax=Phlyctema vagabunda TaxID=108571 RepID=A0ABR4PUV1_9HELO